MNYKKLRNTLYKLSNPRLLLAGIWKRVGTVVPDEPYLKVLFLLLMGRRLDLKNPKTFSEKLQWLKLFDRKLEYTKMVDKFAVKEFVAERIGNEYIIPTIGVYEKAEDIDWDKLPDQFVLKCTHNSGGLVICRDKTKLNKQTAIKKLNRGLNQDYFKIWREWPYKDVPPKIIVEKYIEPASTIKDLPDYKWYCFNGEPQYCQVIQDRSTNETIDFYDTDWNHQNFIGLNVKAKHATRPIARPANLAVQIRIAQELAKDIPFSRIDLYTISNKIYFGEITFYPMSGMGSFKPKDWDYKLGSWINLPK